MFFRDRFRLFSNKRIMWVPVQCSTNDVLLSCIFFSVGNFYFLRPSNPNCKTYYWQSKTATKCSVNESIGAPTTYGCKTRVKNVRAHLPESAGTCAIYLLEFSDGAYVSGKVTGCPRSWASLVTVGLQQVHIHNIICWSCGALSLLSSPFELYYY